MLKANTVLHVDRLFRGHFRPQHMPDYEVVTFTRVEIKADLPTSSPESSV